MLPWETVVIKNKPRHLSLKTMSLLHILPPLPSSSWLAKWMIACGKIQSRDPIVTEDSADVSLLAVLPLFFLGSHSPGAAYPEVPLLIPSSWPLPRWPQCIFSFNTKTLFILEPAFRIRQVSKYLNVWGRDTLHAFHLDRCLNYSGNKYRWWIEKWIGGTHRGSQFPAAGPPKCYCLLLLSAKSRAAASAIIDVWWNCPDGFPEYTHHPPRCITFRYPKKIWGQT